MTLDRWLLTSLEMLHTSHSTLKMTKVVQWKILVRDHSDHKIWTLYNWSVPLDRWSPVFSGKVTNWRALVPKISSEQRDLWPTMKNPGSGPLRQSIFDPRYVIYAFGSMLSCILCERQKFSESHKLKRFGARNQFRAARFVTVSFIGCSLNAMELVVRN